MIGRGIGAMVAAAALVAGGGAQAACWRPGDAQAAHVRRMQTMLMVATLRCRAAHIDIVAAYDGFVGRQNPAIAAANLAIKRHFAEAGGAQADYDRFATSLANGFGDDETSEASCAEAAAIAREAGDAPDDAALRAVAAARVFPAALADGLCEAPPAAPAIAVAVPAAAPAPVTLPAEVVAALTVMARFYEAEARAPAPAPTRLAAVAP